MTRILRTALVLGLMLPSVAAAEDHLQAGIKAFGQADFEASQRALEQARASTQVPSRLAQVHLYLGFNKAMIGDKQAAREAFTTALGYDPQLLIPHSRVKRELVDLFIDVKTNLKGQLHVRTPSVPADVLIDGKQTGKAPLKLRLPIGMHQVEVRGAKGATFEVKVLVGPRQPAVVVAELKTPMGVLEVASKPAGAQVTLDGKLLGDTPIKAKVVVGRHQVVVQHRGHPPRVELVDVTTTEPAKLTLELTGNASDATAKKPRRLFTWIAAGSALGALAAGIAVGVSSSSDFDQWEGDCRSVVSPRCSALQGQVNDKDLASNVLFGVGGALAATAVVLYFLEDRFWSGGEERRLAAQPAVGAGVVGGSVRLSF